MKTKNNTLPEGYSVSVRELEDGTWDIGVWRNMALAFSISGIALDHKEDAREYGFRRAWEMHDAAKELVWG